MSNNEALAKRKLIEVALPLTEISKASRADKDRKVGTLKNLHKWFAPMPLPALRALIFAALVDDPDDDQKRADLLDQVRALVPETGVSPPQYALDQAMRLIRESNPDLPTVMDPFAGSGSTLIEAQRLGLPVFGADLNPVAALMSRAAAELIPPMASVKSAVTNHGRLSDQPYDGFIDELWFYGNLVQEAAQRKLGNCYPKVSIGEPIAWLWARTGQCPNPACCLRVPLYSSPWLSKQKGREAFLELTIENGLVKFDVQSGGSTSPTSTKLVGRAAFACPNCGTRIGEKELRAMGLQKQLGLQLMAACVETAAGRRFLAPGEMGSVDTLVEPPDDLDEIEIDNNTRDFRPPLYGFQYQHDLYLPRQLSMLAAFADEVAQVERKVLANGGDLGQARAIATILGICVGKLAQSNSTLVRWRIDSRNGAAKAEPAFGTQSMPMLWDFAETYPFGDSVGSWRAQIRSIVGAIRSLPQSAPPGKVVQADARTAANHLAKGSVLLVTDPPYFGQINYSGLSDYFYPWLRRALRNVHPDLFGTVATPKREELVANPTRHEGGKEAARRYFIDGFTEVFSSAKSVSRPDLPIVVVYAHMQDEQTEDGVTSSGWESLLEAVFAAGLRIVGTWPIEATAKTRQVGQSANALASYVILVCRPQDPSSQPTTRRSFIAALRSELPEALDRLRQASIPPLDLDQAELGPGMAIFSRYSQVLEPTGERMSVRNAMALIKQASADLLWGQMGDLDNDTRFCLRWFRQYGWDTADSGSADGVARANSTSLAGLIRGGVFWARGGDARLLEPQELTEHWDPATDDRISVWEVAIRLAHALNAKGFEDAARLMAAAEDRVDLETVKNVAYAVFGICRDRGWNQTALLFNGLVTSWPDVSAMMRSGASLGLSHGQGELDFTTDDEE